MNNIKKFVEILRVHYAPFIRTGSVVLLLLIAGQTLQLIFPYLQGKIIDNLASGESFQNLLVIGVAMLVLYIIISLIGYVREKYEIIHFDLDLGKHVEKEVLSKLFSFSLGQHINENSGLRLSVVRKGSSSLLNFAQLIIYSVIPFFIQIVLAAIAITLMNPLLGLGVFIVAVVYAFALLYFNIKFFPRFKENRDLWNKQDKYFSEILRNIKLVKISAKEAEISKEYLDGFESISTPTRKLWKDYVRNLYLRSSLLNVAQVVALFAGVFMVKIGVEAPGKIVMYIGWMASLFGNIGNLSWIQRQLLLQYGDIEKLDRMLAQESAVKEVENPISLTDIMGKIEFQHVSFSYPNLSSLEDDNDLESDSIEEGQQINSEIIRDVSFCIMPGQTVAIVGHSGAGKSTIVNLLLRGYDPDQGNILIDGINLRELNQSQYLAQIGYVPQHVELFDNTLKYNLLFSRKGEGVNLEGDLEEVAKKTRIDQFYERLGETRFDTIIGENGIKLSGGERQRVGIARALLRDPKVLIFDEATSSLDSENESLIHNAMRDALMGRTGIIIAHRLSTVKDADVILVMDSGSLVGTGTHNELMQNCEPYQKLIAHQRVV